MTAATADRNTPSRARGFISVPIAASTTVRNGHIAAVNAAGFAVNVTTATGLTYLGRYDSTVTNAGSAGDASVMVRYDKAFQFANSSADPVTQASLGKVCYMEDNQTVAATNGTNTRSACGRVVGIDSNGVWVE